ncbi:protein CANDIDATE G-PROTEIN COUPLED RECEPTOR 2-like [Aristolochia californica]|uniref:protein CANDIDATE G-PROTEIN COUPLED RECEPTOR 2-like n=1 Tax=Aristolochia californica TaxID=171875 RepID=UPI0035E2F571
MRELVEVVEASLPILAVPDSKHSGWIFVCHGVWYNIALIVPSAIFLVFLVYQSRKSYWKLSYGRSYIMIAYYGLLWLVSVLNFAWCILQAWQCTPGKEMSWNILSLLTTSGMLFLEVSLVAFLIQGNNHTSGLGTLTRTFVISGIIVGVDIFLKTIYVFGFGVNLFIDSNYKTSPMKWGLWIVHKLLLTAPYGILLLMHHSKWREKLPARPAFYSYVSVMFILNAVALFACLLMQNGAGFGFWVYNVTVICYHAFYLPFTYITFLADFFQEEDFQLENVYYSEMKDAGFFDADWN